MSKNLPKRIHPSFFKIEPKQINTDNNSSNRQILKSFAKKKYEKENYRHFSLNNSFSKEFNNMALGENQIEDECILSQSCCFNDLNNIKNDYMHEPSDIILDHYLNSKNLKNSYKRAPIRKKSLIIKPEEISSLKDNQIVKSQIKNNDEFLSPRKLQKIDQEIFNKNIHNLNDENELKELYEKIKNVEYKLNIEYYDNNIGPLCTLEDLFSVEYKNTPQYMNDQNVIKKYNNFKNIIYRYRKIKGDGNCYYRAIMFRYIEIIILNKNVNLFKNIILDMQKCFNSNEIKNRFYIKLNTIFKPDLHLKIMCLILYFLEKKDIKTSHELFMKCVLSCNIFDYGLILYFRYILYLYIKNNENKLYINVFPIKIGNLLPAIYENEKGEFEFNKFYENYLLKMFSEAEKIIIYLTPFVLNIDLDIIIFHDNEEEVVTKIPCLNDEEFDGEKIILLNRNAHYEIIYNEKNYEKYTDIYKIYELERNDKFLLSNDNDFFLLANESSPQKIPIDNVVNKDNNISTKNRLINESNRNKYEFQAKLKENNIIYNKSVVLHKPQNLFKKRNTEENSDSLKNRELFNYNTNNQEINKENIDNYKSVIMPSSQTITQKILSNKEINYKNKKNSNNINKINKNNIEKKNTNESINTEETTNTNETEVKNSLDNRKSQNININNLFTPTPCGHPKFQCEKSYIEKLDNMFPSSKNTNNNIKIINKISNRNSINSNIKKQDNLSPDIISNNNTNILCIVCHQNNGNSNYPDFLLCGYCLKNKIIDELKSFYKNYINVINQNLFTIDKNISASYYYECFDSYFRTNKFLINKIKISYPKTINILTHLTNLSEEEIFKEIKKNFCLCCEKIVSPQKTIILPCGCFICMNEIKKYFGNINPLHSHFLCPCLYKYQPKDFYKLCVIFYNNKIEQLMFNVINFFSRDFLNEGCCICGKELKNEKNKIKYNVISTSELFLGFYTSMDHFECNSCLVKCKNIKNFMCFYCGKEHLFS